MQRALRTLKQAGVVTAPAVRQSDLEWSLPRIVERRPRTGRHHPASIADIERVLRRFGEECVYGIRSVELAHRPERGGALRFGRLAVPGRIVLYDQAVPPWHLPGGLRDDAQRRLVAAGAVLHPLGPAGLVVEWRGASLRDFMLFDVLMHEIGHHRLQHHKGKRPVRIARTADHEAFADAFARRCRELFGREDGAG